MACATGVATRGTRFVAVPDELRISVLRRAGYRCEVRRPGCWETVALHPHHRKTKGRGGPDSYENLVVACHWCHTLAPDSIHAQPARAAEEGLLIPSWELAPTVVWSRDALG